MVDVFAFVSFLRKFLRAAYKVCDLQILHSVAGNPDLHCLPKS